MDMPWVYEIRVEGHLPDHLSQWFDGLAICNEANGEAMLTGVLADQAALFGLLSRIHDLNLILVSLARSSAIK